MPSAVSAGAEQRANFITSIANSVNGLRWLSLVLVQLGPKIVPPSCSRLPQIGTILLSASQRVLRPPAKATRFTVNMTNSINRRRASALSETAKLRPRIILFALLLVFGNAPFGRAANRKNAEPSAKASLSKAPIVGINNFGQVDAHLFRGAQPEPAAYSELKALGIDTVVRFNPEGQDIAAEKNQVESLGMKFVSLPWSGLGQPTHEQVVSFLALLRDNPDAKIFVHCRLGADRTGVMVVLYRLTFSHWTAEQALAEMHEFHYHHLFLPHLQRYVQSFPSALSSDKDFLKFDQPIASLSH
jgi:protein tyrosine phosphatase (PTP) superfamily phosphohydrolase (DUF442 family)